MSAGKFFIGFAVGAALGAVTVICKKKVMKL